MPDKNVYDVSQSDVSINKHTAVNSLNNKVTTVQGPTDDENEIKSWKACTMEISMNNGNISATTMIEHKLEKESPKKFLYAGPLTQVM